MQKQISLYRFGRCGILLLGLFAAAPSHGLSITFNNLGGLASNTPGGLALLEAAAAWESVLHDPIDVAIDVQVSALQAGVLAGSFSNILIESYDNVRNALAADRKSTLDDEAYSSLLPGPSFNYFSLNPDGSCCQYDNDQSTNNSQLIVGRANAKALGLQGNDGRSDGSISFSSSFAFDYDQSNGIANGFYDFVGLAMHEIGHVLGFESGLNLVDFVAGQPGPTDLSRFEDTPVWSVFDLFRYDGGLPALRTGGTPYFSTDGGTTSRGALSSGTHTGDGNQANHWLALQQTGIMTPLLSPATTYNISPFDLAVFDAIGWDRLDNPNGGQTPGNLTVPEPSSLVLLLTAFGGLALVRRRLKG